VRRRDLLAMLAAAPVAAADAAPLRRGVNLTNWFRYPPSPEGAALASYLSDAAMAALRRDGFDFVRLAVQPSVVQGERIALVADAVARLQRQGLAVIVGPHFGADPDAAALADFWRRLAPALRASDRRLTVAEVLNEPVFAGDAAGWAAVQARVLAIIRASLPGRRVVLSGNDWGSIGGLLALRPVNDPDAIYSFHFYDPPELTSLAAYRPGLDRAALARLPFPLTQAGCADAVGATDAGTRDLIRYVCATHWDAAAIAARIGAAASWGKRYGVEVLMGEFGASAALNPAARLGWLAAVRRACEAQGIGWALWGYDDAMGFGVRPFANPAPPVLDAGVLAALGLR
jgi:endoglucanase